MKTTIEELETQLLKESQRHSKEMDNLSSNLLEKIKNLERTQKQTISELERTHQERLEALQLRVDKSRKDQGEMATELERYIKMYEELEKYFKNPHEGCLYEEKGSNNVYEVLTKVAKSTAHIF